jgi:hypothetical protein
MIVDFLVPAAAFALAIFILSIFTATEDEKAIPSQAVRLAIPSLAVAALSWLVWRLVDNQVAGSAVSFPHLVNGTDTAQGQGNPPPWQGIVYFCAMIGGMAAHTTWELLPKSTRQKVVAFDKWRFVRPALVAPIIFLAVWKIVDVHPFGVESVLLSFQNGFFWQTVMSKRA